MILLKILIFFKFISGNCSYAISRHVSVATDVPRRQRALSLAPWRSYDSTDCFGCTRNDTKIFL